MDLTKGLLLLAVLALPAMAGCLGNDDDDDDDHATPDGITSVFTRKDLDFDFSSDTRSSTLLPGPYDILPGVQHFTTAPLDILEGVPAILGDTDVSIGVHFPDIPGCDWGASDLPDHCNIPVVADIGPYYSATIGVPDAQTEGDAPVTEYTCNRLMCTLVDNLVPHGYAVAAVSVMGTGDSGHCMDLMGTAEQLGVQAAVEYLGTQAWSNGNVGLIGRSYDGSTPWEAAMVPSDHLKTIVPISGLQGQYDLMWRNGSAEYRAPGVLYGLYAAMTIDGDPGDPQQILCPDYLLGGPEGLVAYLAGEPALDPAYEYWNERYFFDDVLENYNGSVYYIHGLQDWNVDNHQAFPYYNQLIDAGFEVKGLFGQWDHAYPDRASERARLPSGYGAEAAHTSVRYDWAQDLLEWFNYYLKETGPKPALWAEVHDNMGEWRVELTYPPKDAERIEIPMSNATALHSTPDIVAGTDTVLGLVDLDLVVDPGNILEYEFPALSEDEDTRIAGNVLFHPTVTPLSIGGQLYAELSDAETGLRLGHAIMDLRFHDGDQNEALPDVVVPGQPIVAEMEFLVMDAVLPAGHGLHLKISSTGYDYLPAAIGGAVMIDTSDASVLKVPVVQRDAGVFFTPPLPADEE